MKKLRIIAAAAKLGAQALWQLVRGQKIPKD